MIESFVILDESWLAPVGTLELPVSVASGPNKLLLLLLEIEWPFDAVVSSPRKSRSDVLFEMEEAPKKKKI